MNRDENYYTVGFTYYMVGLTYYIADTNKKPLLFRQGFFRKINVLLI